MPAVRRFKTKWEAETLALKDDLAHVQQVIFPTQAIMEHRARNYYLIILVMVSL